MLRYKARDSFCHDISLPNDNNVKSRLALQHLSDIAQCRARRRWHSLSATPFTTEKGLRAMRDLKTEELTHVYGAGGRGKKWCPPKKHHKKAKKGGGSSKSGSGHGRGGSSS